MTCFAGIPVIPYTIIRSTAIGITLAIVAELMLVGIRIGKSCDAAGSATTHVAWPTQEVELFTSMSS